MTAEEKITFSKLDDGTNVITIKSKNFHGDTYLRQEIFKESSVYDALKRKVESSKELVEALEDQKETLIEFQKFLIKNGLMGSNAYYNAELFLKSKIK